MKMKRLLFILSFASCNAFRTRAPHVVKRCESPSMLNSHGLYRPFAEHAHEQLSTKGGFVEEPDLGWENVSPAKGMKNANVHISCRAWRRPSDDTYARYALLETIQDGSEENVAGIQVFNFGIFPPTKTDIPVLGVDIVTLPGNKNLILMDAQPMSLSTDYHKYFEGWHTEHVTEDMFPWGGDLPEPVQRYVSPQALWARLMAGEGQDDPVVKIQGPLFEAFRDHLDKYLGVINESDLSKESENWCGDYLEYRLKNDPAKPMLTSLYGAEWTQNVLETVLFPDLTPR